MDPCLDTISVLNRTKRDGQTATPYEIFSGDVIDYERDFRCRWGELVIVMNSIGDKSIGFEDEAGAEDQTDIPATGELGNDVGF